MSVPRFYIPPPLPRSATIELPSEAAHHAIRVLRLRVNDAVQVFDGEGRALDATIGEITGKRVLLQDLRACAADVESPLRIVLAQAMCGSEKMDWVVQKATELGATEIQPVQTQRSVAKLAAERAEKRIAHWRSVAIAACEQSGRNVLPAIHAPQDFDAWLESIQGRACSKFILLPDGAISLREQHVRGDAILLIGPEGGFSAEEALMAQQGGFVPIRLGARVLRTETAAIAGIAALQTLWGDFN